MLDAVWNLVLVCAGIGTVVGVLMFLIGGVIKLTSKKEEVEEVKGAMPEAEKEELQKEVNAFHKTLEGMGLNMKDMPEVTKALEDFNLVCNEYQLPKGTDTTGILKSLLLKYGYAFNEKTNKFTHIKFQDKHDWRTGKKD